MDFGGNLVWIIVGIVVLAILAFLLLRPRQRVQLSDTTPVRPHMQHLNKDGGEPNDLVSEAAAAIGDVSGEILDAPRGSNGFGYDPYFFLPSLNASAAELEPSAKNASSHRAIALRQLLARLTEEA